MRDLFDDEPRKKPELQPRPRWSYRVEGGPMHLTASALTYSEPTTKKHLVAAEIERLHKLGYTVYVIMSDRKERKYAPGLILY